MGVWDRLKAATGVLVSGLPAGEPRRMLTGTVQGTAPPILGVRERLEAYETMPWVRAVAGRVADAMQGTCWKLYARRGPGGKIMRDVMLQGSGAAARRIALKRLEAEDSLIEVPPDHPMYLTLANPNGYITGSDMVRLAQLGLDLAGDAFLLKERNALGVPVALWPIPPHWVKNMPSPSKPYYEVSWRGWQGPVPDSEVLWLHNPAPANPYGRGSSITAALSDELQVDEYLAKFANSLFYNRMAPDFLAMVYDEVGQGGVKVGSSSAEVERIEQAWTEKNQGFYKAFKGMFLNRFVDIHEFQKPTMEQLVYPGLRNVERDIILQTWGIPPEQLGITESSNRATAEVSDWIFETRVLRPRREAMRAMLQARLAPEYDERLIVDYEDTEPGDKEHKLAVMKAAPWAFSQEQWQEMACEDEGQEVYMVPLNSYATSDLLDATQRPQAAAGGNPPSGEPAPEDGTQPPSPAQPAEDAPEPEAE